MSYVILLSKEGGEGWLTVSVFCGEASLGGTLQPSWRCLSFFGGCLSKPIFPAQLPPLPVLVVSRAIVPPVSEAAQQGSCCQWCMLIFSLKTGKAMAREGGVIRITQN